MFRTKFMRSVAMVALVGMIATVVAPAMALAGTVTLAGSTTVQPLAQAWANAYHKAHSGTSFSVAGGGSGAGFKSALSGSCMIGMSSREKQASDGAAIMTAVARDALTIIVNPKNNVRSLTKAQVYQIYTGKITTWKQLGGKKGKGFDPNRKIVLTGRTGASGTYDFFKTSFLNGQRQSSKTKMYASNGMVRSAVARDPYAIGYVGMAFVNRTVAGCRIDRVQPTRANALAGRYPYVRFLYFVNYPTHPMNAEAQAFVNYCRSSAGQKIAATMYMKL